ncbi:nuclear transport factor 2 family protein [Mycobacterium barrassiae]|nr:nuclear transport factor 2 family protein [Mycobacterium barrassiae]
MIDFFAPDGSYTDVAMGATYVGKNEILRFHRWMLKFSPDSLIVFGDAAVQDGLAYMEWSWSGSITGPLRLPGGSYVDASGKKFDVTGVAQCRFNSDGKLTSHRDYWDIGLLVEQLGERLAVADPDAGSS